MAESEQFVILQAYHLRLTRSLVASAGRSVRKSRYARERTVATCSFRLAPQQFRKRLAATKGMKLFASRSHQHSTCSVVSMTRRSPDRDTCKRKVRITDRALEITQHAAYEETTEYEDEHAIHQRHTAGGIHFANACAFAGVLVWKKCHVIATAANTKEPIDRRLRDIHGYGHELRVIRLCQLGRRMLA